MAEQIFNDPSTSLNGAILPGATTLVVSSLNGFPSQGNFRIRIDDELMLVTAVNTGTSTWTVTRGIESTTVTGHANGAAINHFLTAGGATQWVADTFVITGTFAALPAAGTVGRMYYFTDSVYPYAYDNGTSWQYYCDGKLMIPPSATGGWTTVNQISGITFDDTYGYRNMTMPSTVSSSSYCYQWVTPPSPPYTRTMYIRSAGSPGGTCYASLVVSDAAKLIVFNCYGTTGNTILSIASYTLADGSLGGTNPLGGDANVQVPYQVLGMRVVDDGTNYNWYYSADGSHWLLWKQWGRLAFMGSATRIGFGSFLGNNNSLGRYLDILHWA